MRWHGRVRETWYRENAGGYRAARPWEPMRRASRSVRDLTSTIESGENLHFTGFEATLRPPWGTAGHRGHRPRHCSRANIGIRISGTHFKVSSCHDSRLNGPALTP